MQTSLKHCLERHSTYWKASFFQASTYYTKCPWSEIFLSTPQVSHLSRSLPSKGTIWQRAFCQSFLFIIKMFCSHFLSTSVLQRSGRDNLQNAVLINSDLTNEYKQLLWHMKTSSIPTALPVIPMLQHRKNNTQSSYLCICQRFWSAKCVSF